MIFDFNEKSLSKCALMLSLLALSACGKPDGSHLIRAEKSFAQHEFYDARIHLLNALQQDPSSQDAILLHARLMLELGDGFAAENSINKLADGKISSDEKLAMLAHSHILQGRIDQALALLQKEEDQDCCGQLHRMKIWAHLERGDNDQLPMLIEKALGQYHDNANILALAGRFAVQNKDWDTAKLHIEKAIKLDPKNYEALILSGELAIHDRDLRKALTFYETASDKYPDHAVPIANIAGLHLDLGNKDKARNAIVRGLRIHPGYPLLHFQDARLHFAEDEYRSANDALLRMKTTGSNFTPYLILSGKIAAKLGNVELAISQLQRASTDPAFRAEAEEALGKIG